MFNSNMQSLLNVSVSNNLLNSHANSALCNVEDDAGFPVVVFIGQSLLLSRVAYNVHDISNFVGFKLLYRLANASPKEST